MLQLPHASDSRTTQQHRSHMQAPATCPTLQPHCTGGDLDPMRHCNVHAHVQRQAQAPGRAASHWRANSIMQTGGTQTGSNVHAHVAIRPPRVALLMSGFWPHSPRTSQGHHSTYRHPHALPTHPARGPLHGNHLPTLNPNPQARDHSLTCPSPLDTQHPFGTLEACLEAAPDAANSARTDQAACRARPGRG